MDFLYVNRISIQAFIGLDLNGMELNGIDLTCLDYFKNRALQDFFFAYSYRSVSFYSTGTPIGARGAASAKPLAKVWHASGRDVLLASAHAKVSVCTTLGLAPFA